MVRGLTRVCVAAGAATWLVGAPLAHAFTIENKDSAGDYGPPKFNLEEQAKNFSSNGTAGAAGTNGNQFSTPLGNGSLNFGVQQGSSFGFGPSFGPATGSRAGRADFERMIAPESLR